MLWISALQEGQHALARSTWECRALSKNHARAQLCCLSCQYLIAGVQGAWEAP